MSRYQTFQALYRIRRQRMPAPFAAVVALWDSVRPLPF